MARAFRQIYAAAGWWNDHWGRVKTLLVSTLVGGAIVLIAGGLLINRFGVLGALAISIGGLVLVVSAVGLLVGYWSGVGKAEPTFPDVEFDIQGTGFEIREEDVHGMKIERMILPLRNVRITNHERERRVSLTFHAKIPLTGGFLDETPIQRLTRMPVDLDPQASRTLDIEFDRGLIPPGAEQSWPLLVEVEEHLSGQRTPIPLMAKWRPAKDGKWEGAFPR